MARFFGVKGDLLKKLFVLGQALLLTGCAGVSIYRVGTEADYKGGIRFYRPQPYLMVTQAKEALQTSVVYLPKTDEEYALKTHSGLGDVDMKATLEQGWNLTELGESRKSATADILTALGGIAKTAVAVPGLLPQGELLSPGLYAIEFDAKTGLAVRLRRVALPVEEGR
jgi:hypothetical protein